MSTPEDVAAGLGNAAQVLKGRETITRVTLIALASVKRETPVKRGTLRRSITHRIESETQSRIGTNLDYAKPVHEGSKPHVIRPRTKQALFWKGANHPVKKVNHPGTKGNPFFTRGLDRARPAIDVELGEIGGDVLGQVK